MFYHNKPVTTTQKVVEITQPDVGKFRRFILEDGTFLFTTYYQDGVRHEHQVSVGDTVEVTYLKPIKPRYTYPKILGDINVVK